MEVILQTKKNLRLKVEIILENDQLPLLIRFERRMFVYIGVSDNGKMILYQESEVFKGDLSFIGVED